MTNRLLAAATLPAVLVVTLAAEHARAYNTKFCVTINVTYTDSSNGGTAWQLLTGASPERTEDNWMTPTYQLAPRGAWYQLKSSTGQVLMQGYLDDGFGTQGAGCTANYTGTQTPNFLWVYSKGQIQSNFLDAYEPYKSIISTFAVLSNVPATGTVPVTFSPTPDTYHARTWSAYVAGAYALYRHAGGATSKRYQFYNCECTTDGTCVPVASNPPSGCICSAASGTCKATNNTSYTWDAGHGLLRTSVFTNIGIQRKQGGSNPELTTSIVLEGAAHEDQAFG